MIGAGPIGLLAAQCAKALGKQHHSNHYQKVKVRLKEKIKIKEKVKALGK